MFRVERCPLLGGSKCISSMVKSIGESDLSAVQKLSIFGGSVIRGFTVYNKAREARLLGVCGGIAPPGKLLISDLLRSFSGAVLE